MIGNFDTHKWFKKQYLEEANINEDWETDVDEDVRSRVSQALTRIEDYKKNTRTLHDDELYDEVEIALEDVIDALNNVFNKDSADKASNLFREGKTPVKEGWLGPEQIQRFEGTVNMRELKLLQDMIRIVSADWMVEGFEKGDIKEYINHLIDGI